jgi:flagellar export protein FliJ
MDRARTKRVERLVELRTAAADVARAQLAEAKRAADAARAARVEAERAWAARAEAIATERYDAIDELVTARDHLASLRRRAEAIARASDAADAAEAARREECLSAERELSKVERWRESLLAAERAEEARRERRETDEIAARTFARRQG